MPRDRASRLAPARIPSDYAQAKGGLILAQGDFQRVGERITSVHEDFFPVDEEVDALDLHAIKDKSSQGKKLCLFNNPFHVIELNFKSWPVS